MSGQGAMIGAAVGATYNAARGKDPLKGAMIGAAVGGTGGAMGIPGLSAGTAAAGTTAAGTGSALTGAGASTAANTAFMAPAGVNPGTVMGASQTAPGIFSNVTAPLTASQPLSSAAGQTAGMERSFGTLESMFNPNIQSSSLNNESFLQSLGSGADQLGKYAQKNSVLSQMAMQGAQSLLQQQPQQPAPAGIMRGSPSQVQMPQYQVGVPKVSLI